MVQSSSLSPEALHFTTLPSPVPSADYPLFSHVSLLPQGYIAKRVSHPSSLAKSYHTGYNMQEPWPNCFALFYSAHCAGNRLLPRSASNFLTAGLELDAHLACVRDKRNPTTFECGTSFCYMVDLRNLSVEISIFLERAC
jgi:hypothetical protein